MSPLFARKAPSPWLQPGVVAGSLFPIPIMVWRGLQGQLGADIIATVLNQLGYLTLTLLTASLWCTPLKIITGWSWSIRLRRTLGLLAFLYASLHFLTYLLIDQTLNLSAVFEDITKRKFILVGFLALVILIPLAITSTGKMVRRLGYKRWKRLHRLVYLAGCLGAVHFIWRVKADLREPLIFAALIACALLVRVPGAFRTHKGQRTATRPATS